MKPLTLPLTGYLLVTSDGRPIGVTTEDALCGLHVTRAAARRAARKVGGMAARSPSRDSFSPGRRPGKRVTPRSPYRVVKVTVEAVAEGPTPAQSPILYNPERIPQHHLGLDKGYRLLDQDEVKPRIWHYNQIEVMTGSVWSRGSRGSMPKWTHRTRLSRAELALLP